MNLPDVVITQVLNLSTLADAMHSTKLEGGDVIVENAQGDQIALDKAEIDELRDKMDAAYRVTLKWLTRLDAKHAARVRKERA